MSVSVGVIGLGAMGSGMAQSVRRAGHVPFVFDVRREVAENFAKDGGVACGTLAELGAKADVIVSVVVNAAQTESVLFGDGAGAVVGEEVRRGRVGVSNRIRNRSARLWRQQSRIIHLSGKPCPCQ